LSREAIVAKAIELAAREGIDAFSMRGLAKALNAGTMSLYNHVSDKDDLIAGMVDQIAAQIYVPAPGGEWKSELRAMALSAHQLLMQHRWAIGVWNRSLGPAKLRHHESILRTFREAGFPEALACNGFHALTMHIMGYSHEVKDMPFSNQAEMESFGDNLLTQLPVETYPYTVEHIKLHIGPNRPGNESVFAYILDLLLDGLERDLRHVD